MQIEGLHPGINGIESGSGSALPSPGERCRLQDPARIINDCIAI